MGSPPLAARVLECLGERAGSGLASPPTKTSGLSGWPTGSLSHGQAQPGQERDEVVKVGEKQKGVKGDDLPHTGPDTSQKCTLRPQ